MIIAIFEHKIRRIAEEMDEKWVWAILGDVQWAMVNHYGGLSTSISYKPSQRQLNTFIQRLEREGFKVRHSQDFLNEDRHEFDIEWSSDMKVLTKEAGQV